MNWFLTPRWINCRSNLCLLWSFSSVVTEVYSSCDRIEKELFNEKYKLTETRVRTIRKVISDFAVDENNANGVHVCKIK